jgi:hypothetical protein
MRINEKLGVPEGINEEAKRLHTLIFRDLEKITIPNYKEGEDRIEVAKYDIKFADLDLKDIPFLIDFVYYKELNKPEILSVSYGNSFSVFHRDRKIRLKSEAKRSTLHLMLAVGDAFTEEEFLDEVKENVTTSCIAHELMHMYENSKLGSKGIIKGIQYASYQGVNFGSKISKFTHLLYYTTSIENVVRPTEVYQSILDKGITKDQFEEFLQENKVIKTLKEAKAFSLEKFKGELESDEQVNKIVENAKNSGYKSIGSVSDDALNLLFMNLVNVALGEGKKIIDIFVSQSQKVSTLDLFRSILGLAGEAKEEDKETLEIADENFKKLVRGYIKYQNNPMKYFEKLEKMLNFTGDKMLRKIYKLYDMVPDVKSTRESIINWELYTKLNSNGVHITIDFEKFKRN